MEYNVINGELTVCDVDMSYVSTGSVVLVGDIRSVSLYSVFEGPPEDVIVGVTPGLLAPEIPEVE